MNINTTHYDINKIVPFFKGIILLVNYNLFLDKQYSDPLES